MQTRIANRQDEKEIRALTEDSYKPLEQVFELEGKDKDLRNIEGNYFGHNGLVVVLEDDNKVLAYIAARENIEDETILDIKRLVHKDGVPAQKLTEMMDIVLNHAYQLDFEKVFVDDALYALTGRPKTESQP